MAGRPSNFEEMIVNHVPIQTSIIENLTRWDFRNLQLAGVRIPIGRALEKTYLKPNRCNETDPDIPFERCANTTKSVDEIRACTGRPLWFSHGKIHLEGQIEAQDIQSCIENERFPVQERNPDNEPNISEYPIHSKLCRRCRDCYAARTLNQQLLNISHFCTPLCKKHSLEHSNQSPLNACRCLEYVNGKWRCKRCSRDTMDYLDARADIFRRSLIEVKIPWSHPVSRLRRLWASETPVCPIERCVRQPWLGKNKDRMQMCLGCNVITRIWRHVVSSGILPFCNSPWWRLEFHIRSVLRIINILLAWIPFPSRNNWMLYHYPIITCLTNHFQHFGYFFLFPLT